MTDLEKKLTDHAEGVIREQENALQDVKLLLESNAQEELSTLKSIGLDANIRVAQAKQEDILIRSKGKEELERTIVNSREIKQLCDDYRLYMLPAKEYIGAIPNELGAELVRFCKEKNIVLPSNSGYSNFYIIAPPKMFRNYKSPIEVLRHALKFADIEREERIRKAKADPILAYKLPTNPNYFAIVKSWGNDFTWLRRIYGFFTQPWMVKAINFWLILAGCFLIGKLAAWQTSILWVMESPNPRVEANSGWQALAVVIDLILIIGACVWIWNKWLRDLRADIIKQVTFYQQYWRNNH